jgi:hypothetical protein
VQCLLTGAELGCERCGLLVQPGQFFLLDRSRELRLPQFGLQTPDLLFMASIFLLALLLRGGSRVLERVACVPVLFFQ